MLTKYCETQPPTTHNDKTGLTQDNHSKIRMHHNVVAVWVGIEAVFPHDLTAVGQLHQTIFHQSFQHNDGFSRCFV